MIITIIANTGLSEPVFPDAASSGHVFIFPVVVVRAEFVNRK